MDDSSEEEEEMVLNQRKCLKELLRGRNKGISGSQPLPTLPPPTSPTVGLLPIPNLKKKRKDEEIAEEGEVVLQKEP